MVASLSGLVLPICWLRTLTQWIENIGTCESVPRATLPVWRMMGVVHLVRSYKTCISILMIGNGNDNGKTENNTWSQQSWWPQNSFTPTPPWEWMIHPSENDMIHPPENEFQITHPWEWVQWSIFKARWQKLDSDSGFSTFYLLWEDRRTCSVLMFRVKELSS